MTKIFGHVAHDTASSLVKLTKDRRNLKSIGTTLALRTFRALAVTLDVQLDGTGENNPLRTYDIIICNSRQRSFAKPNGCVPNWCPMPPIFDTDMTRHQLPGQTQGRTNEEATL